MQEDLDDEVALIDEDCDQEPAQAGSVPIHGKCKTECLAMSAVTMGSKGVEFLSQHASTWDLI